MYKSLATQKFGYYQFLLILFIIPLGLILSSCSRLEEPKIISTQIHKVNGNLSGDLQVTIAVKVTNQNDSEISFTVKNFEIKFQEKTIGYLLGEETFTLKAEDISTVNINIKINQAVILQLLLFGQLDGKSTLDIVGDIIVHHWSDDYLYHISKQSVINLKDFGF